MAAIFHTNKINDNTIFRDGIKYVSAVSIPFLSNLIGKDASPIIITSVAVQHRETVQYILTFDDAINYFHFGKGLGSLVIQGVILSNCDGELSTGMGNLYKALAQVRGKKVYVSIGDAAFTTVLSDFSTNTVADPVLLSDFSLNLGIIDCPALGSAKPNVNCASFNELLTEGQNTYLGDVVTNSNIPGMA